MKLLKTGIAGFDEFCNGGLPSGIIILYGLPGSGNDVFAQQVFFQRAKNGTEVSYLSTLRPTDTVENDMVVYGLNVSSSKEMNSWKFVDGSRAKSIFTLILSEIRKARWVTIDSLSDILLTNDLENVIDLLNSMSFNAKKYEGLHFALLTKGMHDPRIEIAMHHFADGVIDFEITQGGHSSARGLTIKKMRGTLISTRTLPFSIEETGLVVETAVRIT